MKIANPIYDVVFKYLMENNEIAKDILSVILGVTIVSLELQSQEFTETTATGLEIFRLDFKIPVLKVERQYFNAVSKRKLNVKEDFVEKLSHDLYAIQIPRLKMHVRTELEQMLDVFNQNKYKTADNHVLEYMGSTQDPRVARVVRHLERAIVSNPDLLHAMVMEDFMEAEAERERRANEQREQRLEASEKARIEAEKDIEILKEELQKLRLQLQDKNNTPSV
jgi:hypothetical protein